LTKWALRADAAVLTKFGGGVPHTDLSETARLLEIMGVKTAVQVTDQARDQRVESALLFNFPEVDAIVCIGGNGTHWKLPQVERVIAANSRLVVEIEGDTRFYDCTGAGEKDAAFHEIYWRLRRLPDEGELRRIVRDLCARYGIDPLAPCRELCMGWPEIARLAADPLATIGAHTVNHNMLRKLPAGAARAEIERSADVIEASLGKRPRHLSFPVGDATSAGPREFALAKTLGFATAVTTRPGVLFPEHREYLTALPRVSLNGHFQAMRFIDVFLSGAPFALSSGFRRVDAA